MGCFEVQTLCIAHTAWKGDAEPGSCGVELQLGSVGLLPVYIYGHFIQVRSSPQA